MRTPDEQASFGARLALIGALTLPAVLAVTAALPVGARTAAFLTGLVAVAVLCIAGGLACRRALLAGVEHTGRTIVVSIVSLTVGIVAAITFVTNALAATS